MSEHAPKENSLDESPATDSSLKEKEAAAIETWRMLFAEAIEEELKKYPDVTPAQLSAVRNGADSAAVYSENPKKDAEYFVKNMLGTLKAELHKRPPL